MIVGARETADGKLVPRALRDRIAVKPREDLDQNLLSSTILIPDSAKGAGPSPTIDHTAICEVVDIGPGSLNDPDLQEVAVGDIVLFDLFGVSQAVLVDGEGFLLMPFRAVRALVRNCGDQASEVIQPINDWVLSTPDLAAMKRHFYGNIEVPDGRLETGIAGDNVADTIVRCVLDRVESAGSGVMTKLGLDAPNLERGDLVGFSPTESCSFRRFGQTYRLSPAENVLFKIEAEGPGGGSA